MTFNPSKKEREREKKERIYRCKQVSYNGKFYPRSFTSVCLTSIQVLIDGYIVTAIFSINRDP